jgi:hypothetical protein
MCTGEVDRHVDWTEGEIKIEIEIPVVVRYHEGKGRLYWEVFHQNDERGEHNLAPFVKEADGEWIEETIIEVLEEKDG